MARSACLCSRVPESVVGRSLIVLLCIGLPPRGEGSLMTAFWIAGECVQSVRSGHLKLVLTPDIGSDEYSRPTGIHLKLRPKTKLGKSVSKYGDTMTSKYSGRCLCGEINYSTDAEPLFTGNCHCKDCQRSSGSAFIPAMLFPEKNVSINGEVKYFESTSDSGSVHRRGFCQNCGSQLFAKFSA